MGDKMLSLAVLWTPAIVVAVATDAAWLRRLVFVGVASNVAVLIALVVLDHWDADRGVDWLDPRRRRRRE